MPNKILKILFNKHFLPPTIEMHNKLELLLINDIFKLSLLQLVHLQLHHKLPKLFNYFQAQSDNHNMNTRNASKLYN